MLLECLLIGCKGQCVVLCAGTKCGCSKGCRRKLACLLGGEGILRYAEKGRVCREEPDVENIRNVGFLGASTAAGIVHVNTCSNWGFFDEGIKKGLRGPAIVDSMVNKVTPVAHYNDG